MSSYANSKARFRHRASQIGMGDAQIDALVRDDIKSFNRLAYVVCGQPGVIDSSKLDDLVTNLYPAGASLGLQSSLKQLAYEAMTVSVASLKARVEAGENQPTKKMPPQERDERINRQKRQLTGTTPHGEYEPSYDLVDQFVKMADECCLRYMPPDRCISRDDELAAHRQDKKLVLAEGELVMTDKPVDVAADISNELRLHNALVRRGLALDQSGLMSYVVHDKIASKFLSHLTRPVSAHFKGPDIQAVLRADRELWRRVAEECRSKISLGADGTLPIDQKMTELYQSPSGIFHLLPTLTELYQSPSVIFHLLPTPVLRSAQDRSSAETASNKKRKHVGDDGNSKSAPSPKGRSKGKTSSKSRFSCGKPLPCKLSRAPTTVVAGFATTTTWSTDAQTKPVEAVRASSATRAYTSASGAMGHTPSRSVPRTEHGGKETTALGASQTWCAWRFSAGELGSPTSCEVLVSRSAPLTRTCAKECLYYSTIFCTTSSGLLSRSCWRNLQWSMRILRRHTGQRLPRGRSA